MKDGGARQKASKPVEDGVDDHAALGNDEDTAGDTDDAGSVSEVSDAADKLLGDGLLVQTAKNTGKQAHCQKDHGDLIHVPALGDKTPHDDAHAHGEVDKD